MTDSSRPRRRFARFAACCVLAVVAGALLLAACGSSSTSSGGSTGSAQTTTAQRGGTLVVTYQGEPQTLDPAIDFEGNGWAIEHAIFGNLLNYTTGPGAAGTKIVTDMATEVPTVANGGITNGGKTYIFHIRPGIKFAPPVDREVTAADFVYSFQRMMSLPTAPAKGYYAGIVGLQPFLDGKAKTITGYKATGKYTLEVDLQKPIATFLSIMEMPFSAPMAKEWVAKWGKQIGRHPLGTGPYVADHWTASQDLLLKRNTNFTGTTSGYLDAIDFQFSITPTTAVLKVQSGDADLLGDYIPPANFPSLSVNPTWKSQVVVEPAIALDYLFFNETVKPYDNVAVRQALSWAIDRAKIVKLLSGTGQTLNQIYPAGLPGHVDGTAGDFYGYNPAKAKQMLAAAGYPNGFTTTLYSHNVAPWPTVIQSIQYDLAQIGVKASIKLLDRPSYWTLIGKKGAVGAGLNDWWMDYPDPFDYIVSLFSKSSAIDEGTNPSFWWDPKVETDLANAQVMLDPAARLAKFQDIQSYIMSQAPGVPLYQELVTTLHSKRTGGIYLHPVWIFDYEHYWINK
jgi:oligopeptide transport system substrate-binding protein